MSDGTPVESGWFKPTPIQRLVDLQLIFPGVPDFLGFAVEVNPAPWLSIEAGAASMLLIYSFFLDVKSRLLHYSSFQADARGNVFSGYEIGVGPAVGIRRLTNMGTACFQAPCSNSEPILLPDIMLSFETIWWVTPETGVSLQFDGGFVGVRASVGLAFGVMKTLTR